MTNKTIVVIGASRGIGKSIVLELAKDKSNTIIALSRDVDKMKKSFTASNIQVGYIDLQDNRLQEQLNSVLNSVKKIDILINNAGLLIKKPFLELTHEDILKSYQVNAVGIISATQCIVPKMLEEGGHIVNISTMGAFQGSVKFPELTAYSSSKGGLTVFTEVFAEEFKDTKVRMNCLCLGAVQTEMFEAAFPTLKAPLTPAEMAEYIVDFAFHASHFLNGKIIPVSTSTP